MRRSLWLAALCSFAFGLSCLYLWHYLRGGPRIIDATSYWLEARSIASGSFSLNVPDPTASFRGRFLLARADGHELGVIFPPGYPLLLALGMRLGAPLVIGPLLAAALVAATYHLATALCPDRRVAWVAAGLSAVSAALRYHTADTMSHGLSALLSCLALGLALRPRLSWAPLCCGLCLGWLVATRPVSAAVAMTLCLFSLRHAGPRAWLIALLGMLPGLALLLLHQRALTGNLFASTQLAYYAVADAPADCFRYGFGAGVGCRYEHGEFVSRFLADGYGLRAALRNLLVHLGLFSVDATNAVPLSLLGAYATFRHARSPWLLLGAGVLLQALAYVPFYFDGNYPGGGARFLCEAIPLCQVLVARAVVDLRLQRWAIPLSVAGFALHARRGHEQLRDREGGRPMYEPGVVAAAGVTRGLVFVDTDHGFNLGHDPRVPSPAGGVLVARARRDARDRELYERFGRPPTYHYRYDLSGVSAPRVVSVEPPASSRLELEAEWPALLERGSAYPIHRPCASAGQALRLLPGTVMRVPVPKALASRPLLIGWVATGQISELAIRWSDAAPLRIARADPGCSTWRISGRPPGSSDVLTVELTGGEGALDYLEIAP